VGNNDKVHGIFDIRAVKTISSRAPPGVVNGKVGAARWIGDINLLVCLLEGVLVHEENVDTVELGEGGLSVVPDEVH